MATSKPTGFAPVFWRFATPMNLERMGLVRCSGSRCSGSRGEKQCGVFVDPVNVPALRCHEHQERGQRRAR